MTVFKLNVAQKRLACLACGLSLFLSGTSAYGLELRAQFNTGVGASDNIARAPDNEIDETIGVLGVNFGLLEDTSRLSANIRSQFDYTYYADDTFDNEVVGGLTGNLDFTVLEERLTWMVQDNFGQQTSDPFATPNPGNREDVNFFTTGPTVNFLPGSRNILQLSMRYSRIDFEERNTDNERKSIALQLGREIRRGMRLSLNASTEAIEFDNGGLTPDFDRNEGFVRYELNGNRNTLGFDLGVTEVDILGSTSDGVLARLDWTRELTADTTFVLSGGTSFSDEGDIFRFDQNASADLRDTVDVFASAFPFTSNFVSAQYVISRSRTAINVGMNWREEEYEGGPAIDRVTSGANFSLRRDMTQKMFANVSAQYRRRNFRYLNSADDNVTASAEIGYRFGPAFNASLQYLYFERSGDSAIAVARENRVTLRFFYTPGWGR